jgi:flagellar basal body-associated protein FliL
MKRFIVILLILILVAGGGAGALIMLGIVPNPFAPPKPALSAAEMAASAQDKKRFQPPLTAYALVKLDDMIVPVIINGQVTRRVYISARIVAQSRELTSGIQARLSEYQNAVIADLVPFFQNYFLDHNTLDLPQIKERLVAHAKEVYGDQVSDVLLTNVFDQTLGRGG